MISEVCSQIPQALGLAVPEAAALVARRVNAEFGRTTSPKWVEDYFLGKRRPSVSVLEKMLAAAELEFSVKRKNGHNIG